MKPLSTPRPERDTTDPRDPDESTTLPAAAALPAWMSMLLVAVIFISPEICSD